MNASLIEQERADWQDAYDALMTFASKGPFEKEILKAKEIFFSRLGRTHEVVEDLYEFSSQTFLEWYLFEYVTTNFQKSPAVIYTTLALDAEIRIKTIERCLFHHWSLFEVVGIKEGRLTLRDLLYNCDRQIVMNEKFPEFRIWKVKLGQIVQARLYPYAHDEHCYFLTHAWLHPEREAALIRKMGETQSASWLPHTDLLLSFFEAVVRSFGLEGQLTVSQAGNWFYQELSKRYA